MNKKFIVLIALISALVFCICSCDKQDYEKACALFNDGEYSEAAELFRKLGKYDDSEEKYIESCILGAKKSMTDLSFSEALSLLTDSYGEAVSDNEEITELISLCRAHLAYNEKNYEEVLNLLDNYDKKNEEEIYIESSRILASSVLEKELSDAFSNMDSEAVTASVIKYCEAAGEDTIPGELINSKFSELIQKREYSVFEFMDSIVSATEEYSFSSEIKATVDSGFENRVLSYLTENNWKRANGNKYAKGCILEVRIDDDEITGVIIDNSKAAGVVFYPGDVKWKKIVPISNNQFTFTDLYVTFTYGNYKITSRRYDPGTATINYETGEITFYIKKAKSDQTWTIVNK